MAKTALAAPTVAYLLALKQEKIKEFDLDDIQIDLMRRVRALQEAVLIDDKLRFTDIEVRDPTLTQEIQDVVAALTLNPAKLLVTPEDPEGDLAERNASLRQNWTQEVFRVAGTRLPGQDAYVDLVDSVCGDGGGWSKFLFTNDTWEQRYGVAADKAAAEYDRQTEEAKREGGPPFTWSIPDVRTLYPVWSAGKLAEVVEVTKRPINEALRQFRLGVDRDGRLVPEALGLPLSQFEQTRVASTVNVIEHWDREWCSYLIELENTREGQTPNARLSKQFKHGYGQVPYFFAPGYRFNWQKGRKVGWSLAESKRWLVQYRSYLWSLHAQVAARDAIPPIVRTKSATSDALEGETNAPTAPEQWELREIINLEEGESLSVLEFPGVSASLKEQVEIVTAIIDKLLMPRVSGEIGSGMEGAGFAMAQAIAEGRITQDPLVKSITRVLREQTLFCWRLVRDKVRETVWVERDTDGGYLKAGPDDLKRSVGVKWELELDREAARLIEERYWGERIKNGTASRHQAIRAQGDNPDEVDDERELDRIRQTSGYITRHDKLLFQKLDRGDILAQAARDIVQNGSLPNGVMPPAAVAPIAPGGAVPDMANLAMAPGGGGLQTQAPIGIQSGGGAPPTQGAAAGAVGPQGG